MLIKSMDSRANDIAILKDILQNKSLSQNQKNLVEKEISNINKGLEGERKAAYELDFYFKNAKNTAIIHDLRIEHDGRVAQIDHLIIDRFFNFYVLESKYFSDEVIVNDQGEFSVKYGSKIMGVPSPIAQNEKHIAVLESFLESGKIEIPVTILVKAKPIFHNLVTFSSNVKITRPTGKSQPWLDRVMKIDQFIEYRKKELDNVAFFSALKHVATLLFREELRKFAELLAKQHTPIQIDWHARFGLNKANSLAGTQPSESTKKTNQKKEYICSKCSSAVELVVARFCWLNKKRFNEQIYCRSCQEGFKS